MKLQPLFTFMGLLLCGCSGPDLLDTLVPDTGYRVHRDIAYGDDPRQRLDLYLPDGPDADAAPLVVFFYGGGWTSGSKDDYRFVGQALTARGYMVAIPDYRLHPQVRYPAFLEDAAAAVARLHRDRSEPLYLLGHSAGAYIAAMLAVDRRWLAGAGTDPCVVAAMAGLAGPYDFLPLSSANLVSIFGAAPERRRTQPVSHVDGGEPPLLLVTGTADTTVLPRNSDRLAERITQAGGVAERRRYDRIGHVALAASLASPLQWLSPAMDDVTGFFRRFPVAGRGCGGRPTGSSSSASPASPRAPSRGG